jgi:hypothetical protein
MALYGYSELGRFGLTHGILAWARCAIWCEEVGATMIAPRWFRIRVGPYLRRERDKRNYFLLFHDDSKVSGLKRGWLLQFGKKYEVGMEWPSVEAVGKKHEVVVFRNAGASNEVKFFHQVKGKGAFLRARLLSMTRQRYHPIALRTPKIALHVRMGDFVKPKLGEAPSGGVNNIRLPIDWYRDRLIALRDALGQERAAVIFSDGADEDLEPLTVLPNVSRAPKQESVTDLLEMGQSIAVISSGSGFSLWGAFLGNAPRICYPGQMIVPAYDDPTMEIESGTGDTYPDLFLDNVRKRAAP